MKKAIPIILCLCLCFSICFAEVPCECHQAVCSCFIQLGDGGPAMEYIQHALIDQGYLLQANDAHLFDENTLQAVLRFQEANHLPATGTLDDNTLTLLLWGLLPDELDVAEPSSNGRGIWIPTDGGIRRHLKHDCSKMEDPRRVSVRNAELMDMQPCGKCNRNGKKE
ncbi:MAG: peptidoglycan-binding protein [Clostridia bacterium]|nr:peptidoglycan-binding protein [Clostridia bacterium]